MIPLQDLNPRKNPPIVTWALIISNVVIFLYLVKLPKEYLEIFYKTWGFIPALFFDPYLRVLTEHPVYIPYLTLITHLFLHGGWLHLIGNMWVLWIFGDNVEDRLGPIPFIFFYLTCGILASLIHAFFFSHSVTPLVGASGAISGIMGAYFRLFPFARILVLIPLLFIPIFIEVPAFLFLGLWFLLQFYSGLFSLALPGSIGGVAWFAHLGGFLAGFLMIKIFCRRKCKFYRDEYSFFGSFFDLDKR